MSAQAFRIQGQGRQERLSGFFKEHGPFFATLLQGQLVHRVTQSNVHTLIPSEIKAPALSLSESSAKNVPQVVGGQLEISVAGGNLSAKPKQTPRRGFTLSSPSQRVRGFHINQAFSQEQSSQIQRTVVTIQLLYLFEG